MQKFSQFASLLKKALNQRQGIKQIILSHSQDPDFVRQGYRLIMKAVKFWDVMEEIINILEERAQKQIRDHYLCAILILEMMNPNNRNKKIGGVVTRIIKNHSELIVRILSKNLVFADSQRGPLTIRMIRDHKLDISSTQDEHIPQLRWVEYSEYSQFMRESGLKSNEFIIQSKPSSVPAFILMRCLRSRENLRFDVIDCCAAPGNKTLQLAEFMEKFNVQGKVFAFEKSAQRYSILKRRIEFYGFQERVKCYHKDFLTVDPKHNRLRRVKFVLLDPSCSGSGMKQQRLAERSEIVFQVPTDKIDQVNSLAEMQSKLLDHASKLPNILRIVYSTCSVFKIENEGVVNQFLESHPSWQSLRAFPEWNTRGINDPNYVRFDPDEILDGFFIALLKKKFDPLQIQ